MTTEVYLKTVHYGFHKQTPIAAKSTRAFTLAWLRYRNCFDKSVCPLYVSLHLSRYQNTEGARKTNIRSRWVENTSFLYIIKAIRFFGTLAVLPIELPSMEDSFETPWPQTKRVIALFISGYYYLYLRDCYLNHPHLGDGADDPNC